jgi:hypothetical protein
LKIRCGVKGEKSLATRRGEDRELGIKNPPESSRIIHGHGDVLDKRWIAAPEGDKMIQLSKEEQNGLVRKYETIAAIPAFARVALRGVELSVFPGAAVWEFPVTHRTSFDVAALFVETKIDLILWGQFIGLLFITRCSLFLRLGRRISHTPSPSSRRNGSLQDPARA